jgi:MFS family permease
MLAILHLLGTFAANLFKSRRRLEVENLFLRHGALTSPAWQAVVSQLVPRQDLNPAVAANGVGVNVSRAVGPALGGVIVAQIGIAAPFWFNAISNLGVIGSLLWWHPLRKGTQHLPVERFYSAIRTGLRHARNNPHLRATLIRAISFFLFASAYWALLPLVTRSQIDAGADLYGYLLGAIGASAVVGALALPWLKAKLGPDRPPSRQSSLVRDRSWLRSKRLRHRSCLGRVGNLAIRSISCPSRLMLKGSQVPGACRPTISTRSSRFRVSRPAARTT